VLAGSAVEWVAAVCNDLADWSGDEYDGSDDEDLEMGDGDLVSGRGADWRAATLRRYTSSALMSRDVA
jgi:hypothetical protein